MLILSRKKEELCIIVLDRETLQTLLAEPDGVTIAISAMRIDGDKVRLGFQAPKCVAIHREEVYKAIQQGLPETEPC